jgi:AcrR family transcriptional regulator
MAGKGARMKEDRRIQRSRDALHQALVALVLEKGYEAVTIKDIVERANVGRSTFYAHYDSKEDLLTNGLAELRALLTARQRAALAEEGDVGQRCLGFSLALFEHAQSFRDIYRVLVGERGSAIVMNRMRALLADLVSQDLAAIAPAANDGQIPRSALIQFVVGALMSVLAWWMDRKSRLSPAEVDTIFRRLTIPAIVAAFDGPISNIDSKAER